MVGNPPVALPRGGIVMGRPAFTWALQNNNIIGFGLRNGTGCDALTNGTVGQPVSVILYTDANFGYWPGAQDGPDNGNINYPLSAAAFPATGYTLASNSTCEQPVAGPATFTTYTELATPEYERVTGRACTSKGAASPCFTVKFTRRYRIHPNWQIFLE
jgi:hypothetical protein